MSNQRYEGGMYNEPLKMEFLSRFDSKETVDSYSRVFKASKVIEEEKGKDLYDFTIQELEDLFYHMNPSTIWASNSNISIVKSYLDWAIGQKGMGENNINPLVVVSSIEGFAEKFIDESVELFYSKEKIDSIIENTLNAQDAVIVSLIFYGAYGKEASELTNLKETDVNFQTNEVTLTDFDGNQRTLVFPEDTMRLLRQAINETEYYKNNGELSPNARNTREAMELLQTEYVLKPSKTRVKEVTKVQRSVISRRISAIGKYNDIPNFTAIKIQRSGMIYMGKQLLERDGKLEREQLSEICERFNTSKIVHGGKLTYNWHRIKEFVNVDNIKKLYEV